MMNLLYRFLLLGIYILTVKSSLPGFLLDRLDLSDQSYSCGRYRNEEELLCTKNQDSDTLNVTYDCSKNNVERAKIWLWSSRFPEKINTLIIQHCKELIIYPSCNIENNHLQQLKDPLKLKFMSLKLTNISNLYVQYGTPDFSYHTSKRMYKYGESRGNQIISLESFECSLKEVIFENITNAEFDLGFPSICPLKFVRFLKLSKFSVDYHRLPVFNNATIEITSCNFSDKGGEFPFKDASEVIVSNNYFKHLYISGNLNRILLFGNKFELLERSSFNFKTKNIQIVNNIFYHISEGAFESITTPNINISRCYNFTNNIIHSLVPGALKIAPQKGQKTVFDDVIVANNLINCDCASSYWFDSIHPKGNYSHQEYRFYKKWSKENNHNKCLNIPNCLVSQVMKNYQELCEDDYDCFMDPENKTGNDNIEVKNIENFMSNLSNFNKEISQNTSSMLEALFKEIKTISLINTSKINEGSNNEYNLTNFLNFNKEISQNMSSMLEALFKEIKTISLIKNTSKINEGSNNEYGLTSFLNFNNEISQNISNLLGNLVEKVNKISFKNFDNKSDKETYYLSVIESYVLIIIVLFGFLSTCAIIIICYKISFFKVLLSKFASKPKVLFNETEMN